jgi:hypothetical protein
MTTMGKILNSKEKWWDETWMGAMNELQECNWHTQREHGQANT